MKHTCTDKSGKRGATLQEKQSILNKRSSTGFMCVALLCNKAAYLHV